MSWTRPRIRRLVFSLLISLPIARGANAANLVNNGDLETHTFTPACYFNLANATINANVPNVTAFGAANEVDFACDGTPCLFVLPPQSGLDYMMLDRQTAQFGGIADEVSFSLSSPVVLGHTYTLAFYAASDQFVSPPVGPVEVGLSSSASAFGTVIFSGTPSNTAWTLMTTGFVAPVNASYLTVHVAAGTHGLIRVDNFSLEEAPPTSAAPGSWGRLKTLYR